MKFWTKLSSKNVSQPQENVHTIKGCPFIIIIDVPARACTGIIAVDNNVYILHIKNCVYISVYKQLLHISMIYLSI